MPNTEIEVVDMVVLPRILYALAFVCFTQVSFSWAHDTEKSAIQFFINKISPGDLITTAETIHNNQRQHTINLFREGKIIDTIPLDAVGFTSVSGVHVSLNGVVYIWGNDNQSWRIVAIASTGEISSFPFLGKNNSSVYISPQGTVYVPIKANDIAIITPDGIVNKTLEFQHIYKMEMSSNGIFYILGKNPQQDALSITMVMPDGQEYTKPIEGLRYLNDTIMSPDGTFYIQGAMISQNPQQGIAVITLKGDILETRSLRLKSIDETKIDSNGTLVVRGINQKNQRGLVVITSEGNMLEPNINGLIGYLKLSSNGILYAIVEDQKNQKSSIVIIKPDGQVSEPISIGLKSVYGTMLSSNHNLIYAWGSNLDNQLKILMISQDGKILKTISCDGIAGFSGQPEISSNGVLYLHGYRQGQDGIGQIVRVIPEGDVSFSTVYSSNNMKVGSDGKFYVITGRPDINSGYTTSKDLNQDLLIFSPESKDVERKPLGIRQGSNPQIKISSDGSFYVSAQGDNSTKVLGLGTDGFMQNLLVARDVKILDVGGSRSPENWIYSQIYKGK